MIIFYCTPRHALLQRRAAHVTESLPLRPGRPPAAEYGGLSCPAPGGCAGKRGLRESFGPPVRQERCLLRKASLRERGHGGGRRPRRLGEPARLQLVARGEELRRDAPAQERAHRPFAAQPFRHCRGVAAGEHQAALFAAEQDRLEKRKTGRAAACKECRDPVPLKRNDHAGRGVVAHRAAVVHADALHAAGGGRVRRTVLVRAQRAHEIERRRRRFQAAPRAAQPPGGAGKGRIQRIGMRAPEVVRFAAGIGVAIRADGQAVADRRARVPLVRPAPPGRFENVERRAVEDQEGVVVVKRMVKAAVAALAILLEQREDHRERIGGGAGALERKAQQVHSGQARPAVAAARENGLVADADAALVYAHLRAPHPDRPGEQHRPRFPHLRQLDAGGAQPAGKARARRIKLGHLRFVRAPVAVLGEQRACTGEQAKRIAHLLSPPRNILPGGSATGYKLPRGGRGAGVRRNNGRTADRRARPCRAARRRWQSPTARAA